MTVDRLPRGGRGRPRPRPGRARARRRRQRPASRRCGCSTCRADGLRLGDGRRADRHLVAGPGPPRGHRWVGRRRARCEVDLCRQGPHALVAGTTGSGKSELLQTLIAGLAANHPPDRCSFLLVDYKGGAAFAEAASAAAHRRAGHRPRRADDRAGAALARRRADPARGDPGRPRGAGHRRPPGRRCDARPAGDRRRRVRRPGRGAAGVRARAGRHRPARAVPGRAPRARDPAPERRRLPGDPGQLHPADLPADDRRGGLPRRPGHHRRPPTSPSTSRAAPICGPAAARPPRCRSPGWPRRPRPAAGDGSRPRGAWTWPTPSAALPSTASADADSDLARLCRALARHAAPTGAPPPHRPWRPPLPDRITAADLASDAPGTDGRPAALGCRSAWSTGRTSRPRRCSSSTWPRAAPGWPSEAHGAGAPRCSAPSSARPCTGWGPTSCTSTSLEPGGGSLAAEAAAAAAHRHGRRRRGRAADGPAGRPAGTQEVAARRAGRRAGTAAADPAPRRRRGGDHHPAGRERPRAAGRRTCSGCCATAPPPVSPASLTADRAVPGGRLAAVARQRLVLPLPDRADYAVAGIAAAGRPGAPAAGPRPARRGGAGVPAGTPPAARARRRTADRAGPAAAADRRAASGPGPDAPDRPRATAAARLAGLPVGPGR